MTVQDIDIPVATPDGDIKSTSVVWYDGDEVFIMQHENNTGIKHTVLLEWSEAQSIRNALNRFLEERALL